MIIIIDFNCLRIAVAIIAAVLVVSVVVAVAAVVSVMIKYPKEQSIKFTNFTHNY